MQKIVLTVLALVAVFVFGGCNVKNGNGEKLGRITKLSQDGYWCPTWEAEIMRGGLANGSGVMGASFHFTIEDMNMKKQIEDALNKQQEIKIFYHSEMWTVCRSGSNDYFLDKVEIVDSSSLDSTPATTTQTAPATDSNGEKLSREKIAEGILRNNDEILRQNKTLIEILNKEKEQEKPKSK